MNNHQVFSGTIGGTLLSIGFSIDASDLIRTAILATVGAVVSFVISVLLKWLVKAFKKSRNPN